MPLPSLCDATGRRRSFGAFPGWAKATQGSGGGKGVKVGLGAEVTVVVAPDNTTTRKCQIWGFFLLSVPCFGLCYFPPQSTLVVSGAQTIEEKTEAYGMGFGKIRNCLWSGLSWDLRLASANCPSFPIPRYNITWGVRKDYKNHMGIHSPEED